MSDGTALTMEELELEQAELLPARETLGCFSRCGCGPSVEVIIVARLCL
jgi:hypothetical protein